MMASQQDHAELLELIRQAGDRIPDAAATEAEDDTLLTIRSVRAGHEVSHHEIDAARGYIQRLLDHTH